MRKFTELNTNEKVLVISFVTAFLSMDSNRVAIGLHLIDPDVEIVGDMVTVADPGTIVLLVEHYS